MPINGFRYRAVLVFAGAATLLGASPAAAQQMDLAAYNTWAGVTVVHYVAVGEYSAKTSVATGDAPAGAMAVVKDPSKSRSTGTDRR